MKNEKILLVTLIFILQSFPSFGGSLDGKGFICKEYERSHFELPFEGFLFEDNMLVHYQFIQSKNHVIIDKHNYDYKTDENSIHWKDHRLDRKSLFVHGYKDTYKQYKFTHLCEQHNANDFMEKIYNIKKLKQKRYNKNPTMIF